MRAACNRLRFSQQRSTSDWSKSRPAEPCGGPRMNPS